MTEFENRKEKDGFTCKLWRGERMTLIGFDVDHPEPDFVGFAIECKEPGDTDSSRCSTASRLHTTSPPPRP